MALETNETLKVLRWDNNEPTLEGLKRFKDAISIQDALLVSENTIDCLQLINANSSTLTVIGEIEEKLAQNMLQHASSKKEKAQVSE